MFQRSSLHIGENNDIERICVPPHWPNVGTVQFKNVYLRYQKDGEFALKGINANIPAGSKFVIVGRTGSGKSSLISTIVGLRRIDSGTIMIDGQDISKIETYLLRSSISVISQDPTLLQGEKRTSCSLIYCNNFMLKTINP